ncbi:MAG TPA: TRAP transporter TatT component family protein, partial [Polyangiaceae bacterium]|nr:TRAP transporter TatT component family protein [Polyangiaceae bacterium]
MNGSKTLSFSLALVLLVVSAGCNLPGLLIRGTTDGTREFTKERGAHFADPEMVGPVLAASTVTSEGFIYYVPDYEPLLMSAIFSNIGYGVAWILAEANEAELKGDFETAEKLQARAGILFGRALFYTKRMLRLRDSDFDEAMAAGNDAFNRWVDENFYEESDAEPALIAGLGFLVAMIESEEGLAAAVDL